MSYFSCKCDIRENISNKVTTIKQYVSIQLLCLTYGFPKCCHTVFSLNNSVTICFIPKYFYNYPSNCGTLLYDIIREGYSRTSISVVSINGGILGLEFSEVILSMQNDLYNLGARDHFLINLSLYVVNYTILIKESMWD